MSPNCWLMDPKVVSEILEYPGQFANDNEKDACHRLVQDLTPQQQEIAARTSYAYWVASATWHGDERPSDQVKIRSAMKEARRHFVGEDGDYDKALESLRNSCSYREEWKVDLVRHCFDSKTAIEGISDEDREFMSRCKSLIKSELEKQTMAVRGQDRDGRVILHRSYRTCSEHEIESYTMAMIFMAEKAFACNEALSRGKQEKIVCVFDYSKYVSSLSPPVSTIKKAILLLQRSYPERVKVILVLDAPFWMRGIYALISPFLAKETREKLKMVMGPAKKETVIGSYIEEENSTPFMLAGGKLSSELEIERGLHEIPFHKLYDL